MDAASSESLARATARVDQGGFAEAVSLCREILASEPSCHPAINLLGVVGLRTRQAESAAALFAQALRHDEENSLYRYNLAVALRACGKLDAALAEALRVVQSNPNDNAAYELVGKLLGQKERFSEAIPYFQRSFELSPNAATAHALGHLLKRVDRTTEAISWLSQSISLQPTYAEPYVALSFCHLEIGSFREAKEVCARALQRGIATKDIFANLGVAEMGLLNFQAAVEAYENALSLDPKDPLVITNMASSVAHLCDWEKSARYQGAAVALTLESIEKGGSVSLMPFTALTLDLTPATQLRITQHFVHHKLPRMTKPRDAAEKRMRREQIVLGYFSNDFRNHPVIHLAKNLFKHHDRNRFRVVAFSTGPDDGSEYRRHVERTCDEFIDIRTMNAATAVERIKTSQVDILIDMTGHTGLGRWDVLAERPAPVQLHFLGYPGTLATTGIDYFVTDHFLSPPGSEDHFTEKLIYMPDTYQISDDEQKPAAVAVSRADEGLPADAFIFCSLNSAYKIEPRIFDCWMEILKRTPGSVLWLLSHLDVVVRNLREAARVRGVDPGRLIFANRVDKPRHLARHVLADLFLDTHIVCGHTTVNDALLMGLPVVACPRANFISRVSSTLLQAHGLGELVCENLHHYVEQAVALWEDRDRLCRLRRHLEERKDKVPARDTARFVRHLERAYSKVMELHWSGCPPEPIDVAGLQP